MLLVIIYISFISLGLPDGLLGSAWPSMYESLAVPVSFAGITVGRFLSGFLTAKYSDKQMVRIGNVILAAGIFTLFLPLGNIGAIAGLFLIGLGCAPVYPCLIYFTPEHFGDEKSQAVIGVQMASAYVGSTFMPLLFGILANHISIALLPVYIGLLLTMMFLLSERLNRMMEQIAEC